MKYHSRTKVKLGRRMMINVMYGLGIKTNRIADWFNISRATVYRHIRK
tara:strand:- start:87 stop:230 length:144 start_codon:yes stop_codon:yes gene_type:complete